MPTRIVASYNIWRDKFEGFYIDDEPIQIPINWSVSQVQALEIAKNAVDLLGGAIIQSDIEIPIQRDYENNPKFTRQRIAWRFMLATGPLDGSRNVSVRIVLVDAQSGEILSVVSSAGGGSVETFRKMIRIAKNIPGHGSVDRSKFPKTVFEEARRKQKPKGK